MQIHKLEHVQSEELPKEWRNRLNSRQDEHYTVFLLSERQPRVRHPARKRSEQPLIGLWADRDDMQNVDAYVRNLRKPRC